MTAFLQNELKIDYILWFNMLLKCSCFILLQNSNLISCNNWISCCDKAKLRSAKTIQYRDKLIATVLHDTNNRTRVYSAQCACLLVDMYKKINKVHFFQLVPRPISTLKEGDWAVVIYEGKIHWECCEWPGCQAVCNKAIGHKHSARLWSWYCLHFHHA